MKDTPSGFTLIQLMIVVAILGILAAVAIPSYRDYTVRTKTIELFTSLQPLKTEVAEYYNLHGSFPLPADLGISASGFGFAVKNPTHYNSAYTTIELATWGGPQVIILAHTPGTFFDSSNTNSIVFGYEGNASADGTIVWTCRAHNAASRAPGIMKFFPKSCQDRYN